MAPAGSDRDREPLRFVTMGLGWDPVRDGVWSGGYRREIDLNAAALLYAGDRLTDVVYHEQLLSQDGAVRLLGDNLTGHGAGDDEVITIDLTRSSPRITSVLLLVTSYSGQAFDVIENGFCRLVDGLTRREVSRFALPAGPDHTGFVLGRLHRDDGNWQFHVIGVAIPARHPAEAVPHLEQFLG
ncbi:TerD family protein [Nocardia sp. NPDC057227]|uniref:TerD family protein n=1 Tax=Nocardia sp. NPDC057227 TaxID=3346056 RepID=UPI00362AD4F5